MIRRNPTRAPGRHRAGQVPAVVTVRRRVWDRPARAEAEHLTLIWPGWTIFYGVGSRQFYAIASWPTPEPVMVCDRTAEGLEAQMHEAEIPLPARYTTPAPPHGSLPPPPPQQARRQRFPGARRRAAVPQPGTQHSRALYAKQACLVTPTGARHDRPRTTRPGSTSRELQLMLEQTYPGWSIRHDPVRAVWTALRHTPLTDREVAAGVRLLTERTSAERLATALADQAETLHTLRARHAFTTPTTDPATGSRTGP